MENGFTCNSSQKNIYRAWISAGLFAVCVLFAALGMTFFGGEGNFVLLQKPDGAWYDKCVTLCLFDVAGVLFVTLSVGKTVFAAVSVAVVAVRSVSFGAAVAFCTENSAVGGSVAVIVSFAAVTLLVMAYCSVISGFLFEKPPRVLRLLCYLAVTGAAVILRVLPYLIIRF